MLETLNAGTELVEITGTYATQAALFTDIGTTNLITKSAANDTTNALLIAWSDGTNTHITSVADAGADAAMTTAELTGIDLVVLSGVVTGFHTDNFEAIA
jgi:hypothetical protein